VVGLCPLCGLTTLSILHTDPDSRKISDSDGGGDGGGGGGGGGGGDGDDGGLW
jgi:hypothetical protein